MTKNGGNVSNDFILKINNGLYSYVTPILCAIDYNEAKKQGQVVELYVKDFTNGHVAGNYFPMDYQVFKEKYVK